MASEEEKDEFYRRTGQYWGWVYRPDVTPRCPAVDARFCANVGVQAEDVGATAAAVVKQEVAAEVNNHKTQDVTSSRVTRDRSHDATKPAAPRTRRLIGLRPTDFDNQQEALRRQQARRLLLPRDVVLSARMLQE